MIKELEKETWDNKLVDEVNHPTHYNHNKHGVECNSIHTTFNWSDDEFKGYLKGNAIKYLWRYGYKDKPKQDLDKAQWYLNKLIEEIRDD